MQLFVRGAQTAVYEISSLDDVSGLKTRIAARTGIQTAHQILSIGGKVLKDDAQLQKEATVRLSLRLRGGRDDEPMGWTYLAEDAWFGDEEIPASMERNLSHMSMEAPSINEREFSNVSFGGHVGFGAWVGDFAIAAQSAIAASAQMQVQPVLSAPPAPPAQPALPVYQEPALPVYQAGGFHDAFIPHGTPNAAPAQLAATSPEYSTDDFEAEHAGAPPSGASPPALQALVLPSVDQSSFAGAAGSMPKVTIGRGQKGLAYDLDSVDDKVKRRLIKNRLSAERSRLRKNARMVTLEGEIGQLDQLRAENAALHTRLAAFEAMARKHGLPLP